MPKTLYKYACPERLDVLQTRRIAYTPPRNFNDPFEAQPFLRALASEAAIRSHVSDIGPSILAQEISKLPPELRALLDAPEMQEELARAVRTLPESVLGMQPAIVEALRPAFVTGVNRFSILCLAQSPTDLLMWAHYGASHEGICIGFDATHSHFDERRSPQDSLRHLRPVTYQADRPKVDIANLGELELYLTKGLEWEYEQEWRIARDINDADEVLNLETGKAHLFSFPPEAVRSLVLGCRSNEETRRRALGVISTEEWSHVELLEAIVHESEYQVELRQVV